MSVLVANLVNGANVRVIWRRGCLRLPPESFKCLWVSGNLVGQGLESHKPVQACVFRFVHNAHAAATEFLDDAVVGNRASQNGRGISHWRRMLGCAQRQVNRGWLQDLCGRQKPSCRAVDKCPDAKELVVRAETALPSSTPKGDAFCLWAIPHGERSPSTTLKAGRFACAGGIEAKEHSPLDC